MAWSVRKDHQSRRVTASRAEVHANESSDFFMKHVLKSSTVPENKHPIKTLWLLSIVVEVSDHNQVGRAEQLSYALNVSGMGPSAEGPAGDKAATFISRHAFGSVTRVIEEKSAGYNSVVEIHKDQGKLVELVAKLVCSQSYRSCGCCDGFVSVWHRHPSRSLHAA